MIAQKKKNVNLFEVNIINGEATDNPEASLAIEVERNNIILARPEFGLGCARIPAPGRVAVRPYPCPAS